jgi:hypothetical protein
VLDGLEPFTRRRFGRNIAQLPRQGAIMLLTFIGKDPESNPTGSPTMYRTDRASWVVQGWVVDDPDALTEMNWSSC